VRGVGFAHQFMGKTEEAASLNIEIVNWVGFTFLLLCGRMLGQVS